MPQVDGDTHGIHRKEMELLVRKYKQLQDKLDRITEISSGIIYVLDAGGNFTYLNKGVQAILHYKPEELLGKHYSILMNREEYEKVGREYVLPEYTGKVTGDDNAPKLFDERRSGERRTKDIIVKLLTKERREVKVLKGEVSGIMGSAGYYGVEPDSGASKLQFIGSQGIIFDITRYEKAEKQRLELEKKFYEVQKYDAVGRLAGGAAHHFNNKLGTILGYAELLAQKHAATNPEIRHYVEQIISATGHIADLTTQLLAFARQGTYQMVSVNLNRIMLNVSNIIVNSVRKDIVVTQNFDARNPVVAGDPSQIKTALLNVALNACDAVTGKGELIFETRIVEIDEKTRRMHDINKGNTTFVLCSIIDNGEGMDDLLVSKIFEPFFSTRESSTAVGMGLACVYGCIEKHHGFIDVASEPGKGTRFDIYLPYAGDEVQKHFVVEKESGKPVRGEGTILVVDDDDDIRRVMRDMLVDLGYNVVICENGAEAVRYYEKYSPRIQCAVIDLNMPRFDGIACYHAMYKIDPGLKVVFTTGSALNDDVEILVMEKKVRLMAKPFEIIQLSRALYDAIKQ